jgi:hypothetical protein
MAMASILTPEDVVRRIAAECTFIDERGAVGIRLKPAAVIVRQYGEQFRRPARRKQNRRPSRRRCRDAAIRSSPIPRRWLLGTVLNIDGWGRIIVTTRLA